MRQEGINMISQDHTLAKWPSWDFNSGLSQLISPKPDVIAVSHYLLRVYKRASS